MKLFFCHTATLFFSRRFKIWGITQKMVLALVADVHYTMKIIRVAAALTAGVCIFGAP